ncbi:MAG: cytochrome c maturation protein CcmE [Myxococcota bacterium]|nr:cytochrome c maturation protein CcmE [Myxococcota bacterium]
MEEQTKKKGSLRWVVFLLVGVAGFYVFISSAMEGGAYFLEVDEALAAKLPPQKRIRVKGTVVQGTYVNPTGTTEHKFAIESGGNQAMNIYYKGPLPDVFSEGREVVVEGLRGNDGVLVAKEVTAKCPSKYEGGMSDQARQRLKDSK